MNDKVKSIVRLETGSHYWWRHKRERIWRVCYIGNDHDNNQWLHPIGLPPMEIADMDLSCFDWHEINQPNATAHVRVVVSNVQQIVGNSGGDE